MISLPGLGSSMVLSRKKDFTNFDGFRKNQCKLCGGCGTEKHRLYACKGWNNIRMVVEIEVKHFEKIALHDL